MGLTRSLSTGASSLRAHQQRFDVISNNLANANTIGFKNNKATFQEQFNQIYSYGKSPDTTTGTGNAGGVNPLQFGLGVKMGAINQDFSQGVIENTNRPLDLALQGDGFFIFNHNGSDNYSRAGSVTRDKDGFFVDTASGAYLQGYNVQRNENGSIVKDSNGINQLTGLQENMQVADDVLSSPRQTQNISLWGNLNSSNPEGTEKHTSIKIFDQLGNDHELKFTFTKTANANEYSLAAQVDGQDLNVSENTITFNNDGTLNSPLDLLISAADLNTAIGTDVFNAADATDISVSMSDPDNLLSGLTQLAGQNQASFKQQDGFQAGQLQSLEVDEQGRILGSFTNGQTELMGQTLIARFTNNEGLVRKGDNFYAQSPNSGAASVGTAGDLFASTKIIGYGLEQSNVDMTVEFTEMISTQRAFEAASRIISVSDQLLGETTGLKR